MVVPGQGGSGTTCFKKMAGGQSAWKCHTVDKAAWLHLLGDPQPFAGKCQVTV